jgi:hypothetical protein
MLSRIRTRRPARLAPSIDFLGDRIAPSAGFTGTVEVPPNDPCLNLPAMLQVQSEEYRIASVEHEVIVEY